MRHILLLVTVALVLAVMMMAIAAPGFARANHLSGTADINGDQINVDHCQGKGVITPSGNVNVQCKSKLGGGNKGGAGGGGATVERGGEVVPHGEGIPVEGQAVETPSGNVNAQGKPHPKQP